MRQKPSALNLTSFLLILLLLAVAGCRGSREAPPPPPENTNDPSDTSAEEDTPVTLELLITASSDVNNGNAAVIRIYQLSNETNFKRAPLETFWQDDRAALSDELIGRQEFQLFPDENRETELTLDQQTRFLGFAANLRHPASEGWRQVYPLDDLQGRKVTLHIGSDRIRVKR